jgi:beta-lactamase superfamily II metal-dependent hydrolase
MGYEIDFLPVGNGDSSGDAIAARWGTPGNYKVLVYDGGTAESGEALVKHVREHYETERVDYVVSSHPDNDHASGLSVVLDELEVGELWMHRPWEYSSIIRDYFHDGRLTDESLAERLKTKMRAAHALEELAIEKGIPIYEPFQGSTIGPFTVLSPESEWYIHELIPAFEKSPKQKVEKSMANDMLGILAEAIRKAGAWIAETWGVELLREGVETSAENESSVILFADFDGRGVLLTGDAGIQALNRAADYAALYGVDLPSRLKFVQVPHHGSRHNVSTSVLNRIVGPRRLTNDGEFSKTAFVSAGKESTTHPRKMVTNAFHRRGARPYATKGVPIHHFHDMSTRGWGAATIVGFSNQVESWD